MTATLVTILYFLFAIAIIVRLLLYGVRPTKTLAWLLAIFTIPIGGMLFYFMLGRNRKINKFYKLKKTKEISDYLSKVDNYYNAIEDSPLIIPKSVKKHIKLARLIAKSAKFLPSEGNKLTPLKEGPSTFEAIFKAIENATHFIHLQYYIYEDGDIAEHFLTVLEKKIKEGVEVRFIYDGLGSRALSKRYIKALKRIGVEVYPFLPIRFGKLLASVNYRNHRKIVIVDGMVAFIGGINISDKYIKGDGVLGMWHDLHLELRGSIVNSLQVVFAKDWSFASGQEDLLKTLYFSEHSIAPGKSTVQAIESGPDSDFSSIHQLYLSIINSSEKYVYITNPYIIPGEALMKALQIAALSGVDVRLLLSAKSDNALVKYTVQSYFEDFMEAGVKIYQYPDGFLHSKVIISDDELTTIGTANLDIRSFEQNYEVNVVVYEKEITEELKKDFFKHCEISTQISYKDFIKRSKIERLKEGFAKVFSPVL
ncbi:cardiolipin synthase [Winogradskyella thalassocola]|uniref:Cardiolipin synthase n=1 Tax=Winogradskyella thalassocola TaxID=262004 RepID=A0A1G8BBW8_9FLAO|nr:cardiolipin synthase [Winogradskyella thalassocola]SDH30715.1 cardiolipin synthase [Winogradskyella thalassocola]